jgi:nicotinamide-nucleotide amidase
MKIEILGVSEDTLSKHGAVSPEIAEEMAAGVRALSGADIGVGITGIAGPEGGSEEKPVGLVYVSVCSDSYSETKKLLLSRGHSEERDSIRYLSVLHALSLILKAANAS